MARSKGLNVGVKIKGDAKDYKTAAAEARTATQKLSNQFKKQQSTLGKLTKSIKMFGIAALTALGTRLVSSAVGFGKQLVKLAGDAEGVKQAFNRLNEPGLLYNLQKATRGTVSDLELMKRAVQAKNFRIPLKELATYFEFATKRAAQTGESVDYLTDSIVLGLGRGSVKILDNLGLSIQEIQKRAEKMGSISAAAASMIKEELIEMGEVTRTTTQKTQSLSASWSNFKVRMGENIVSTGAFVKVLEILEVKLENLLQMWGTGEGIEAGQAFAATLDDNTLSADLLANKIKELETRQNYLNNILEKADRPLNKLAIKTQNMSGLYRNFKTELNKVNAELNYLNQIQVKVSKTDPTGKTVVTIESLLDKRKLLNEELGLTDIYDTNRIRNLNLQRYI